MAASPPVLPSPGTLIVDNLNLLAGSPTAFHSIYSCNITPTSFAKPGNTSSANALLHFLISIIDADVAEALFKPCWPILDRDQERDFRRVIDARLQILEKTKLLPVGSARKSVVSSAGGDRFTDLLWSLSSLAVQQACLRHPAYGTVSRLRLITQQVRTDSTLSHQSSLRTTRSSHASRSEIPQRQRRFLGVGMLSAAQQRAKDADEMRTRIEAERLALQRTSDMGKQGAKTWTSEADSLRDKIGDFEAKLRMLKGQLADMGFDENGIDMRAASPHPVKTISPAQTAAPVATHPASPSSDLTEELKTSPIESMESGSSVDELPEPTDACVDIAADLNTLLTFSSETRALRTSLDQLLEQNQQTVAAATSAPQTEAVKSQTSETPNSKENLPSNPSEQSKVNPAIHKQPPQAPLSTDLDSNVPNREQNVITLSNTKVVQASLLRKEVTLPTLENKQTSDIVELVRAATTQLEQATSRMEASSYAASDDADSKIEDNVDQESDQNHAREMVSSAIAKHKSVLESSRKLSKSAKQLTEKSRSEVEVLDVSGDEEKNVNEIEPASVVVTRPSWILDEASDSVDTESEADAFASLSSSKLASAKVETAKDLHVASRALQASKMSDRKSYRPSPAGNPPASSILSSSNVSTIANSHRRKDLRRSDSQSSQSSNKTKNSSDSRDSSMVSSTSSKSGRSVRFAALPPSYSATRACLIEGEGMNRDADKCAPEELPTSSEDFRHEEEDVILPNVRKDHSTKSVSETVKSVSSRRTGKKEENMKREVSNIIKPEASRKSDAREDLDNVQKPPAAPPRPSALQRKHTPRRIMRRKEALHRAAVLPGSGGSKLMNSSKVSDSADRSAFPIDGVMSDDETTSRQRNLHSLTIAANDVESKNLNADMDGGAAEGSVFSDPGAIGSMVLEVQSNPDDYNLDLDGLVPDENMPAHTSSTPSASAAPRRMFLTSEPVLTRQSMTESKSHVPKKQGLLKKAQGSVFGHWKPPRVRSPGSGKKESRIVTVPSFQRDSSLLLSSGDDEELLFSPVPPKGGPLSKSPINRILPSKGGAPPRANTSSNGGKGDGFFAGQTAQWQQNVRGQSSSSGVKIERSLSLASAETLANRGKSGKGGGLSGKRSRVQSFKARLAALK